MRKHLWYLNCIYTITLLYFEIGWEQVWVQQVRGTECLRVGRFSCTASSDPTTSIFEEPQYPKRKRKAKYLVLWWPKKWPKGGVKSDSPLLRSDIILAQSHETLSGVLRSSFIRPDSQSWTIFNRGAPLTRNNSSESPQHHIIIPHHTGVNKWSSWGCWCDSERLKWAISGH